MKDQSSSEKKPFSSKNSNGSDHRYIPRWKVSNRILYLVSNDKEIHECHSKDLSCAGACIKPQEAEKLSPKQKVKLTIYLSENVSVNVEGEVVWKKTAGPENLVGILFANTSQKTQELILKHAFEIKKEELIQHWFKGWKSKN